MSGIMNKVKEAMPGHHGSTSTTHTKPTADNGPHDSKLANKLDPRVDSERATRENNAPITGGFNSTKTASAHPISSGTKATNAGPHNSNMMNKADPRVDSDRDNRARHQAMGGAAGPHSSDMMNKMDPRVDSDRDNRGAAYNTSTMATGPTSYSASGVHATAPSHTTAGTHLGSGTTPATTSTSTNAGPHNSNMMNKVDPRVDSDRDNRARHQAMASNSYTTAGAGTGAATAGPHGSNVMNKMDPRVDSDLDNRGTTATQRYL